MIKNRIIPTVGISLLIPLWVWAQGPAPEAPAGAVTPTAAAPAAPPTEAEKLLDEAAQKVGALESVSADLVQQAEMLKQKFVVKGRYLKATNGRVSLRTAVTGLPGSTGE